MLFVTADKIGKGIGKKLLLAIEEFKISKVDANIRITNRQSHFTCILDLK
jgi:hypothetical protein